MERARVQIEERCSKAGVVNGESLVLMFTVMYVCQEQCSLASHGAANVKYKLGLLCKMFLEASNSLPRLRPLSVENGVAIPFILFRICLG